MDEISFKILGILQEKARIPNVEVARQVKMAPSAVLERIRKLEKQGIIDGYEVRLNYDRFDRGLVAFVFIDVEQDPGKRDVGDILAEYPEIQEVHYAAGGDEYLIKVRVSDTKALDHFLRDRVLKIEGIRKTRTVVVLSTFKETSQIPIEGMHLNGDD